MHEFKETINLSIDNVILQGELVLPVEAKGIVLFAHGSGSSRFSPRNQFVAQHLQKNQLGTLLVDLLTKEEEEIDASTKVLTFNIEFLAHRLFLISEWLLADARTKNLSLGLFGASTGAAAALNVAAQMGSKISGVVSRGGRPDLAMSLLSKVSASTLLIVGGDDFIVIELNQKAYERLTCIKNFEIIPGATHLFEEKGALEKVASLSAQWFINHLT